MVRNRIFYGEIRYSYLTIENTVSGHFEASAYSETPGTLNACDQSIGACILSPK